MKLILDGVKPFLQEHGAQLSFRKAAARDRDMLLHGKLHEESLEWLMARDDAHALIELGDMLLVLEAMADSTGFTWEDVVKAAKNKKTLRGDYTNLTIMDVKLSADKFKTIVEERQQIDRDPHPTSCYSG